MQFVLIALAAAVILVVARHSARPRTSTADPYTVWMLANLPRLRSWRR